jgi:hypothetical protein
VWNPIFKNWYRGKKPRLQLHILESIVTYGGLSKRKATDILGSNYPDVSDAMDSLASSNKKFIKFTHVSYKSPRQEKFYKITERGLRALLAEDKTNVDLFWKETILLSIFSKSEVNQDEFEEYYRQFTEKYLGHSIEHGYLLQSHFFYNLLDKWLKDWLLETHSLSLIPIAQRIIECLAFNGAFTLEELVGNVSMKKEDIVGVLERYSIQKDLFSSSSFYLMTGSELESDIKAQKKVYFDFVMHTLVVVEYSDSKDVKYKLSLFGVMLTIALIRYHHIGIDRQRYPKYGNPNLYYNELNLSQHLDKIANNYEKEIPLIFGKWSLLKTYLGEDLLYASFDFFFYEQERSNYMANSVWFGGRKEFYDDIQSLADNIRTNLNLIYIMGVNIISEYQPQETVQGPKMDHVRRKLKELEWILKYANITTFLEEIKTKWPPTETNAKIIDQSFQLDQVKTIEKIFADEVSFLFYFNFKGSLNVSRSYRSFFPEGPVAESILQYPELFVPKIVELSQELSKLGSPRDRLITILTKDLEIKQWFFRWIDDIMGYRQKTNEKMSYVVDRLTNVKRNTETKPAKKHDSSNRTYWEEYDVRKICSAIESD